MVKLFCALSFQSGFPQVWGNWGAGARVCARPSETFLKTHQIGIIMNGVTGRMGTNQHLMRSIVAIREQGGVAHQ